MKRAWGTLLVSVMMSILYLGLAILGRGGFAAFFSLPALSVIAVVTGGLVVAGLLSQGNLSRGESEDRANRWVLAVFAVIGFASAYLPTYTDRIGFWTLDGDGVRWLGVALFVAGGVLRMWPVFALGGQFSGLVAIQPGHKLVTTGVYGIVRNPSYLGLLINALGWALAFRSAIGLLLAILYLPPLLARMRSEEMLLRSHFGKEYDAYCARTSRLVPGLY
jgi:protein-S-isoprenylcysteine O-methyltransferase Ste14